MEKLKIKINHFLTLVVFFVSITCNSVEPPTGLTINLTFEDVSCTEAWMTLSTNLRLPATIELKQNNQNIKTINLNNSDSLLYIDSLLPNTSYTFEATNNAYRTTSNQLQLTTLDTTSHDFTWQQFTFGEYNPSTLYDVAIVGEEIWAVGAIYMKDSLGNDDPIPYNAIHWYESYWELKRITVNFRGNLITPQLEGVFAFSSTDIWFVGSLPTHGDGENWTMFDLRTTVDSNISLSKVWGYNPANIYFVGLNGNIARYRNGQWTKLESGTDVDLLDVWGSPDGSVVWACGYYIDKPGTFLLRSIGGNFEMAYDGTTNEFRILQDTISGAMTSVYTPDEKRIFICTTSGVYNSPSNTNGGGKRLSFTPGQFPGLPYRLRGNGVNDFTIAGDHSFIAHYNGYSWRNFEELLTSDIRLLSVTQKGVLVVAVGYQYLFPFYNPVIILVGMR